MNKKDIPNIISILRIIVVVPITYFLWYQQYSIALILFLLGGLSDGLDGFLARRYHWQTKLGVVLDPMGDKLMMLSSYLLLGWHTLIPWWLVALVISRDGIIVVGTLLYKKYIGEAKLSPLFISKLNTTCQIILVLTVMLAQVIAIPSMIVDATIVLVTLTTLLSGYAYIDEWGKRAWKILKGREAN